MVTNTGRSPVLHIEGCREEIAVAFVSANHPLAAEESLELQDLNKVPLIIRGTTNRGRGKELLSRLEAAGIPAYVFLRFDSADSVKASVARSEGVGILYQDLVEPGIKRGNFKTLIINGVDLKTWSYIVYVKDRPLSRHAQEFLALLHAHLQEKAEAETV